jgi:hypothetical protein
MIDPLEPLLTRLPAPEPPPTLAANVMARIERLPDRGAVGASVGAKGRREGVWWISAIAGALIVLGITTQAWMDAGYLREAVSARLGLRDALPMVVNASGGGLLLIGLWLFLFGLFGPLDGGRNTPVTFGPMFGPPAK